MGSRQSLNLSRMAWPKKTFAQLLDRLETMPRRSLHFPRMHTQSDLLRFSATTAHETLVIIMIPQLPA